ncbi:MAG: hypothetical protein IJD17_07080 [Clostridia bacterium]|nr:hypothetical protein [Clostridia bacterium]
MRKQAKRSRKINGKHRRAKEIPYLLQQRQYRADMTKTLTAFVISAEIGLTGIREKHYDA